MQNTNQQLKALKCKIIEWQYRLSNCILLVSYPKNMTCKQMDSIACHLNNTLLLVSNYNVVEPKRILFVPTIAELAFFTLLFSCKIKHSYPSSRFIKSGFHIVRILLKQTKYMVHVIAIAHHRYTITACQICNVHDAK